MVRLLEGLNREIQDILEMQEYVTLEEMVHKAILIEQQTKRRGNTRYPLATPATHEEKGKGPATLARSKNIKCFRCQGYGHYASDCTNKKIMTILAIGEVVSEDDKSKCETDEDNMEYPVRGEMIVTRRALNVQSKAKETEQRENLFHTRCMVRDKMCSLIIDRGSCTNDASERLVEKLGLATQKHPRRYQLQWLNDTCDLRITKQVKIPISIGRYKDEITWMPWQYDNRSMHDGFTNIHSFTHGGKHITL
ncbi:hypothetical protein N665_0035s0021, partial [Sinapis alba]